MLFQGCRIRIFIVWVSMDNDLTIWQFMRMQEDNVIHSQHPDHSNTNQCGKLSDPIFKDPLHWRQNNEINSIAPIPGTDDL